MAISILGIAAFLVYWLHQNYQREENALLLKTRIAFRETVLKLQASRFATGMTKDSAGSGEKKIRVFVRDNGEPMNMHPGQQKEIVSTVNLVRDKMSGASVQENGIKRKVVISLNHPPGKSGEHELSDLDNSISQETDPVMRFFYGVDSLQDSIRVAEVYAVLRTSLEEQKISIPFSVFRLDTVISNSPNNPDRITIGFAHPVTYQFVPGNYFPYMLQRMATPLIFSILLLAITILAFSLLYRSLLQQHRLAALKSEFISNITHELKTPIATVGVAIEALKNFDASKDPLRNREYLDISSNELQRLNLLVDKVLKLSMFEKKDVELKKEPLILSDLVKEVLASLRLQLEKRGARVSFTESGDLQMRGDRLHLLSVVFNLLDNALKYSRRDPVIEISVNGTKEKVELVVKDTGIGIPPEYHDKVFDKFFRVPHGDTHDAKGYGLGLSYVLQVVKQHQGSITVKSTAGSGTTFIVELPKHA